MLLNRNRNTKKIGSLTQVQTQNRTFKFRYMFIQIKGYWIIERILFSNGKIEKMI